MKTKDSFGTGGDVKPTGRRRYLPPRPDAKAELAKMIEDIRRNAKSRPYQMPADPWEAADWFMHLMEPLREGSGETAHIKCKSRSDEDYWEYPYLDRLKYLLAKYVQLSSADQAIIVGCCEDGVYWRGENMRHFYEMKHSVYNETMRMREIGASAYITEAKKRLAGVLN